MKNKLEKIHLSINNETKCYVSYDDYKKMRKSYKDKLKEKSKMSKKEYKIGDEVKWCGLDWYVIDFNNKLVKLMSKEVFEPMTYSDKNSNDYKESNVKEYLEECFINQLDKSKLFATETNYDEDKYVISKIKIPTLRDIEKLPMNIRKANDWYWTMTASYAKSEDCDYAYVFTVNSIGRLGDDNVDWTAPGVRPVITLSTDELE